MPFMLRRTKSQVLKELPPKIIQDVFVELSPLQTWLYNRFEQSQVVSDVQTSITGAATGGNVANAPKHVFQALQYLRKLCSHPLLALESQNTPGEVKEALVRYSREVCGKVLAAEAAVAWAQRIEHAPKLVVLKQLLEVSHQMPISVSPKLARTEVPVLAALNPPLAALNPPPAALNPPPVALNPPPVALNPPPAALNAPHVALNPTPQALNPPPVALNPPPVARLSVLEAKLDGVSSSIGECPVIMMMMIMRISLFGQLGCPAASSSFSFKGRHHIIIAQDDAKAGPC
jgi:hypothetical protein